MGIYIAIRVAYIATNYHGWQFQPDKPTIEGVLRQALLKSKLIHNTKIKEFKYAGRTDKGVNAIAQTIVFPLNNNLGIPDRFLYRINTNLPKSIRCWAYSEVMPEFHPRFDAVERTYQYSWYEPGLSELNWNLAIKNSQKLIGFHDFQNFAKKDNPNPDTKRKITAITIKLIKDDLVLIELRAPSFLWQQCRRISSHLLQLARNEVDVTSTLKLLASPVINKPQPLPPDFLTLTEVKYLNIHFNIDKYIIEKIVDDLNFNLVLQKRIFTSLEVFKEKFNQML